MHKWRHILLGSTLTWYKLLEILRSGRKGHILWLWPTSWSENVGRKLLNTSSSSHGLNFLQLKVKFRISSGFFTVPFVFFIDIENQLLDMATSQLILVVILWTNAKMERFIAFFLPRSFLKTWSLSSQSKLDNLSWRFLAWPFAAHLYNSFHVTSFCSDKSSCYLEVLVVVDLYIESAGIFQVFILILALLSFSLCALLLLWSELGVLRVLLIHVNILIAEVRVGHSWHRLLHLRRLILVPLALGRVECLLLLWLLQRGWSLLDRVGCNLFSCFLHFGRRRRELLIIYPFNRERRIVLIQVKIVQWLLGKEGGYYVLEGDKGNPLLGIYFDISDLSEHFKYLYYIYQMAV